MVKRLNFLAVVLVLSPYVLPYPGLMPGHRLYPVKEVWEQVYQYFVFGNFSQHKYHLGLTDQKLVESKTLFEYQQYLLALKALGDSDWHWQQAVDFLLIAEREGKNINRKMANLEAAAEKHQETLENLKKVLPKEFLWQPEKKESVRLFIDQLLDEAIKIRQFR